MLMFLYIIVLGYSLGLYHLEPLIRISTPLGDFNGEDISLILLLLASAPAYVRQRRVLVEYGFRKLEFAWLVFVGLLAVSSFYSPAVSLTERFVHLRFVQGYLMFFPSVAILTSERRVKTLMVVGIVMAIAGTVLTIAQSLYGPTPMFKSDYYHLGGWEGSGGVVEGVVRVTLPIYNWIAFVLLVLFAYILLQWRWWAIALAAFLFITIILTFFRSLWLAMACAFALEAFLLVWWRGITLRSLGKLLWLPAAVLLSILITPYVGLENITEAIVGRVSEGLYIFTTASGTWGVRLDDTEAALKIWRENWLFGVGTYYYSVFPKWLDLGIAVALLSVGVVGLMLSFYLMLTVTWFGLRTLRFGLDEASLPLTLAGIAMPAQVVLMIVYQWWLPPTPVVTVLGLGSALAVAAPLIFDEHEESPEEEDAPSDLPHVGLRPAEGSTG
jgi:hypothetical protein